MSCLFKSNISFMSQFLKIIERPWKILICWHQSIMMPKYTTEHKYNFKYLSSMVCLFIPEKAQRADQDIFSCGAQELPTRLITKKMLLHATRYHGEEPLHALLMLHFFPLFFYLENKDTAFFYTWKALSTFTLETLLFIFFSVQSTKGDVLSDQFVLLFDFLLSSNLVSHYYFAFLTNRQLLLASLLTCPSPLMSFFTTTWMVKTGIIPF